MAASLTAEQAACRAIVQSIKSNTNHRMTILMKDMHIELYPDKVFCHDMALALQDYFRRKGKDKKREKL